MDPRSRAGRNGGVALMAPPPRQVRLTMDAFPDCPQEFRGTLERLLGLLNESQTAVSAALNKQLTRAENMRGGYVTISGVAASGQVRAQCRNPLDRTPAAVYGVKVERTDGAADGGINWSVATWRSVGDGMLEVAVVGLFPGVPYRITLVVE